MHYYRKATYLWENRQLDLFADNNPEPPSQAHSPTSRAVVEAIEPRCETLCRAVIDCIRRHHQLAQRWVRHRRGGDERVRGEASQAGGAGAWARMMTFSTNATPTATPRSAKPGYPKKRILP
jgi:hypothetical protein